MKQPLYAAAGIPEYWIADLKGEQLIFYSGKDLREVKILTKDQMLESSVLPMPVAIRELLG